MYVTSGNQVRTSGTAEASQSLYLQVHKMIAIQFLCHQQNIKAE
jgi:hypothetical protein